MRQQRKSPIKLGPIARKVAGSLLLPKGKTPRELLTEALEEKYQLKR